MLEVEEGHCEIVVDLRDVRRRDDRLCIVVSRLLVAALRLRQCSQIKRGLCVAGRCGRQRKEVFAGLGGVAALDVDQANTS